MRKQVPLILEATETVRGAPFILSRSETGTSIVVVWGPRPSNCSIGHFEKYHNTLCLSPQILHEQCFQFLLGLTVVPGENKNNAHAKFGRINKEYYGIFQSGLLRLLVIKVGE